MRQAWTRKKWSWLGTRPSRMWGQNKALVTKFWGKHCDPSNGRGLPDPPTHPVCVSPEASRRMLSFGPLIGLENFVFKTEGFRDSNPVRIFPCGRTPSVSHLVPLICLHCQLGVRGGTRWLMDRRARTAPGGGLDLWLSDAATDAWQFTAGISKPLL